MKVKFLKALSILLSLLMAFSVCSVVAVADETPVASYYVKAFGTGDGSSASSPAPTVAAAIATMKANGDDVAGNTVNIYLINPADGVVVDGNKYHNLPSWRDAAGGEAHPTYSAKILVQPYEGTSVCLAESTKHGDVHTAIYLGGPTEFKNVAVVTVRNSYNAPAMNANGNDFTWSHTSSQNYYYLGTSGVSGAWGVPIVTSYGGTFDKDFTVNVNGNLHYGTVYIGNNQASWGNVTYNGNVTYVLNNNGIGSHSQVPGAWVMIGGVKTTFNKNLNVVVKDVSEIGFKAGDQTVTVAGGVQYMVAPGETVTHSLTDLTCFAEGTKFWTLNPTSKAVMDYFTFTDEAGVYKVTAEGKGLIATDENGKEYKSEDGLLKVPAGTYTIDEYILPVTKEFFVKNGGTGDGTSRENPASSVAAVMATVKAANLAARDTALITILEREDWNAAPVNKVHNMTYIADATNTALTNVTPNVVIQGDPESDTKVHLAALKQLARHLFIGESVTFKNLVLVGTDSTNLAWYLDGGSATFESDVEFAIVASSWAGGALGESYIDISANKYVVSGNYTSKQNIEIKAPMKKGIISIPGNNFNGGITHAEDLNLVLDNAQIGSGSAVNISFSGSHSNSFTTKYSKNVNINVKNATAVNFVNGANGNGKQFVNIAGGLQLILNPSVTYNTTDIGSIASITDTTPIYVIKNDTGNADIITFTSTAGTYNVAEGKIVYAINDATNEKVDSQEGKLVLTEGTWTLYEYIPPKGVDYFVKYGGTGDGRTLENPAPSVYAVTAAIAADLTAKDTAYVNIIQSDTYNQAPEGGTGNYLTPWTGGTPVAHTAKMVVQGYNGTKPYLAYGNGAGINNGGNVSITLAGPTVIKSVTLVGTWGNYARNIYANGYDITVESTVGFANLNAGFNGTNFGTSYGHIINTTVYSGNPTYSKAQTITYNAGTIADHEIRIPSGNYSPSTYKADLNLIVDAAYVGNVNPLPIYFGCGHQNSITSNFRNININIKSGKKVSFGNGQNANGKQFVKANAIQAILNPNVTYNTTDIKSIAAITDDTPVYVLKVYTDVKDAIGFTDEAGVYTVNVEGQDAIATAADGTTYQSDDGILKIATEGQYDITFIEEQTNDFDEYINKRGSNLQNTYKKLTQDKELKVVYFGGSVTNGYGIKDGEDCWRTMIGKWLQNTFPQATVTNVNKACGESGTYLGSYRLTRDILAQEPDLLFLEYSINDKYDYASREKASYQYETIVRQVKEKYPDCDIVTILVTDSGAVSEAHKGNLHSQAEEHEKMAQIYNIPSLHVGRRLADATGGTWNTDISIDTVHLTEYGNQLYYDVIHEYFANELIHGTYDGTAAEAYVMPELQNEYLLDGNITYIEPSQALVDRSEELGGTGITYAHAPEFTTPGYDEIFNIRYNNNSEKILAIEFEGTELIGLFHNYSKDETFQISIDGGEYVTKNFYHMNPTTFVTGLDSGKHIARIKFTVTESRSWTWLGAIFSRDAEKRTAKQYAVDVEGGNAYTVLSGENVATTAGTEVNVTLKADVPAGYEFTGWDVVSGEVALADATAETTTFKMTTAPVAVKANYKATTKAVTVNNGTADKAIANIGETVTITANAAEYGYVFDKWVGNADFADATAETTTFTMPEEDVVVTATYKVQPDDGSTDVRDLVRLKKFLAGILPVIGDYADYNKDGVVDAADLVTLRKIIIGAIEAPTSTAIVVTEDVEIDEIIDLTGSDAIDAIAVEGGVATINGGYYNGGQTELGGAGNTAVFANGGDVVINDGEFTVAGLAEGDTGHIDLIYAKKGTITINGGFFYGADDTVWLINCNDANYKNGTANIVVKGGTFVNYNPADNASEGKGTNFVADGYTVVAETQDNGDVWYTVVAE